MSAEPGAVLFDLSARSKVEIRGRDRASFLHNFCTQDIQRLPVGQGCEALLLNVQARILAHVFVFARANNLWLDAEPGQVPRIIQHLDRYLITEQVELLDCTTEYRQWHLAGRDAGAALERVLGSPPPELAEMQHAELAIHGASCQVRRIGRTGPTGFDIVVPATHQQTVSDALHDSGAVAADAAAFEVGRIEAGRPVYGVDFDEGHLPQELGRDAHVLCFTKGCYLGQEPVVRIRDLGHVNRRLVGLKVEGSSPPGSGARITRDGQEIGKVTSAVFSPRVGSVIALAYLRRGQQEPGTAVQVEAADGPRRAEVAALPFVST